MRLNEYVQKELNANDVYSTFDDEDLRWFLRNIETSVIDVLKAVLSELCAVVHWDDKND